ncbi:hypothetical protein GTK09_21565 [Jiella sp. 40Bstr34]|uniref:Uncharacterized protein n=1 Tax=Jiella pacifica TaxID=2696469 RepID=A0A6N9T6J0_9HYPH|nr:hypothetical protein [Jiella pacifica]
MAFIDDGGGAEPLQTERTASGSGEESPTGWFSRLQRRYHLSFVDGFGLHLEGSKSFASLERRRCGVLFDIVGSRDKKEKRGRRGICGSWIDRSDLIGL